MAALVKSVNAKIRAQTLKAKERAKLEVRAAFNI